MFEIPNHSNQLARTVSTEFVHSTLAADPDLGELVEMFVDELPKRITALETYARSRNWEQLTRTAHQLKGAAGSYGFHPLTHCAARLERAARERGQDDEVLAALDILLSLCRRVRAGVPQLVDEREPNMRSERP